MDMDSPMVKKFEQFKNDIETFKGLTEIIKEYDKNLKIEIIKLSEKGIEFPKEEFKPFLDYELSELIELAEKYRSVEGFQKSCEYINKKMMEIEKRRFKKIQIQKKFQKFGKCFKLNDERLKYEYFSKKDEVNAVLEEFHKEDKKDRELMDEKLEKRISALSDFRRYKYLYDKSLTKFEKDMRNYYDDYANSVNIVQKIQKERFVEDIYQEAVKEVCRRIYLKGLFDYFYFCCCGRRKRLWYKKADINIIRVDRSFEYKNLVLRKLEKEIKKIEKGKCLTFTFGMKLLRYILTKNALIIPNNRGLRLRGKTESIHEIDNDLHLKSFKKVKKEMSSFLFIRWVPCKKEDRDELLSNEVNLIIAVGGFITLFHCGGICCYHEFDHKQKKFVPTFVNTERKYKYKYYEVEYECFIKYYVVYIKPGETFLRLTFSKNEDFTTYYKDENIYSVKMVYSMKDTILSCDENNRMKNYDNNEKFTPIDTVFVEFDEELKENHYDSIKFPRYYKDSDDIEDIKIINTGAHGIIENEEFLRLLSFFPELYYNFARGAYNDIKKKHDVVPENIESCLLESDVFYEHVKQLAVNFNEGKKHDLSDFVIKSDFFKDQIKVFFGIHGQFRETLLSYGDLCWNVSLEKKAVLLYDFVESKMKEEQFVKEFYWIACSKGFEFAKNFTQDCKKSIIEGLCGEIKVEAEKRKEIYKTQWKNLPFIAYENETSFFRSGTPLLDANDTDYCVGMVSHSNPKLLLNFMVNFSNKVFRRSYEYFCEKFGFLNEIERMKKSVSHKSSACSESVKNIIARTEKFIEKYYKKNIQIFKEAYEFVEESKFIEQMKDKYERKCSWCEKSQAKFRCCRCKIVYCGRDCQKKHWKFHKIECI